MERKKVCILGAGISGLSLAHYLKKYNPRLDISVLEKNSSPGGVIGRIKTEGFIFDTGPKTFRVSKSEPLLDLIYQLGLQDTIKLSDPKASLRYLYHKKRLHLMPSTPFKALTSKITRKGLLHLLKEMKVKPVDIADESVGAFVRRRFGNYIADVFFDPFTLGIYASDMHNLSVRTCFPFLKKWEESHGSVLKALLQQKKDKQPAKYHYRQSALLTLDKGFYSLIEKMSLNLEKELKLDQDIIKIEKFNHQYKIFTQNKEYIADGIFSALPLQTLKTLDIPFTHAQKFLLQDLESIGLVTLQMEFDKSVLPLKGFGYLVPSKEQEDILGVVFDSEIFKNHDKKTRLTMMMGGGIQPQLVEEQDETLKDMAFKALGKHLKIYEKPSRIFIKRYRNAIPEFRLYHQQKIEKLQHELDQDLPKFYLAGNYIKTGSVNSCIQTSEELAKKYALL